MDEHVQRIVRRCREAYRGYVAGTVGIEELQGIVQAAADATDNSSRRVMEHLQWLDAELETVRFMTPAEERQREVEKCFSELGERLGPIWESVSESSP